MRVFIGLELDAATVVQIADWRDRCTACDGKPVPPANFHITLAFVGELSDSALQRLCESIDDWLENSAPAGDTLNLDCPGYWDKQGIYWLGPTQWPDSLTRLSRKLRGLATKAGAKLDRNPFQPHVSLYRRCSGAPPAPTQPPAITMSYQHVALFESCQGKQGVSYRVRHEWALPR